MKIDVSIIIRDHIKTLYNSATGKVSIPDITLFYATPFAVSITTFALKFSVKLDVYSISITFFGIFIALLLNIQVAIFSIFMRKIEKSQDTRLALAEQESLEIRDKILRELNTNISYLVLVCCTALVSGVVCYVMSWTGWLAPCLTVGLYIHFVLTIIMVVKRSHILFHSEYARH